VAGVTLGRVPAGCRRRLTTHYGPAVTEWLDRVPGLLRDAAAAWGLRLQDYHDAGHASALVQGISPEGQPVMVKAWYDQDRFRRETMALRHWEPINGHVLRASDPGRAVACLTLVGGQPAGRGRPVDAERAVARALARLHRRLPPPRGSAPNLDDYLREEVEPRMRRRLRRYGGSLPRQCVDLGVSASCAPTATSAVLLHADLYQENVPFDRDGRPVFLDPLPMLGDPAFDWSFFVVYFDQAADHAQRLRLAAEESGIPARVLLPWCLRLALDGLLYYRDVGDRRERPMVRTMAVFAAAATAATGRPRSPAPLSSGHAIPPGPRR
jgi:streptomycin 6-kinase